MVNNLQMVIANRLADGRTVFLAPASWWVEDIAAGQVAGTPAAAAELLKAGRDAAVANLVLGPELIPVTERAGRRVPLAYREAIRAGGPTVEAASRTY